nr:hypothetical protein [Pontibacter sp. E15-1]
MLLANEVGYRIGHHVKDRLNEDIKKQAGSIHTGILGLLGLLLAFTFNMSMQRYDNRSYAVIKEANAIGTALLRTQLLPSPYDSVTYSLLQQYVAIRLKASNVDLTRFDERHRLNKETDSLQHAIWRNAMLASDLDARPVTTGYFIAAMNETIDARGERNAILERHVPEPILLLLYSIFIASGVLMGYLSGLGTKRSYVPTVIMTLLIVLLVFIIIDLDRPRRGLIKIRQDSMVELLVQ